LGERFFHQISKTRRNFALLEAFNFPFIKFPKKSGASQVMPDYEGFAKMVDAPG
jgi:hypothetical protein